MLTRAEALARVLAGAKRLASEDVALVALSGRVLAEDVVAPRAVPPWANSAMDGYALRAVDLPTAGALPALRMISAGDPPGTLAPGECVAIMTGAPVPAGADAVIPVEDTDTTFAATLARGEARFRRGARVGENVRPAGEDIPRGAVVLTAGTTITPAGCGLLASLGLASAAVVRRPRVALLSTGDELVRPGEACGPGQIFSSNHATLAALVEEAGGIAVDFGIAKDDPADLERALREMAADADVLVTSGGVSVGEHDHVKAVMATLGARMDFWKVAMKPGKPLAFGFIPSERGDLPLLGLPGNPVSSFVNFLQFVRPLLRTMLGDPRTTLPVVRARAAERMKNGPGRETLCRVILSYEGGEFVARSAGNPSSGALWPAARGHGLWVIPAEQGDVEAGEVGSVEVFGWGFLA